MERGQGEPLVLIHGLGCSGAAWAFQVAALEKQFRVIVPDLPGSGHSPPPRDELGMRRAACLLAIRLFQEPWQRTIRKYAAAAVGAVPASSYLGMGYALARWTILDRLDRLTCRVLLIAAEHDFTPLEEKRELAAKLRADLVVVRGSRHGTPFDSVDATNASLLALLTDRPLPPQARWIRDSPTRAQALTLTGSFAEEHATGA